MNNIQKRVAELHEKDELEKQRQLKEVEDFYRNIEEDLMVEVMYREWLIVSSKIIWDSKETISTNFIQELYLGVIRFTDNEIHDENYQYLGSLNSLKQDKIKELLRESLSNIGFYMIERECYSGLSYYEDDKYEITRKKPVTETVLKEAPPPFPIIPILIIAFILCFAIGWGVMC